MWIFPLQDRGVKKFSIVQPLADAELVCALTFLLEAAKAGRIIGLAYVALHPGQEFSGEVIGTCRNSPLVARGLCRALEDSVSVLPRKVR